MKKEYIVIHDGCYSSIEKVDYKTNKELLTLSEAKKELIEEADRRIRDYKLLKANVKKLRAKDFQPS